MLRQLLCTNKEAESRYFSNYSVENSIKSLNKLPNPTKAHGDYTEFTLQNNSTCRWRLVFNTSVAANTLKTLLKGWLDCSEYLFLLLLALLLLVLLLQSGPNLSIFLCIYSRTCRHQNLCQSLCQTLYFITVRDSKLLTIMWILRHNPSGLQDPRSYPMSFTGQYKRLYDLRFDLSKIAWPCTLVSFI